MRVAAIGLVMATGLCAGAAPTTAPTTAPVARVASVDALVARLGSDDPAERERVRRALMALGAAAREALVRGAGHPEAQVRETVAEILLAMPFDRPDDPPSVGGFLRQYGRPTAKARVTYLPSVVSAAGPGAAPRVLLRLVEEDPSDEVRWAIVGLLRGMDPKALPAPEAMRPTAGTHAPNLALAGWVSAKRDPRTALGYYRACLECERVMPTRDMGQANFVWQALLEEADRGHDYELAWRVIRARCERELAEDPEEPDDVNDRSSRADLLFAMEADFGPLRELAADAAAYAGRLGHPQALYALGRMYEVRLGQRLVADALYRGAGYAAGLTGVDGHDAAAQFLIERSWDALAEREAETVLALLPEAKGVAFANASFRMGAIRARRGDDLGAARHKERGLEAMSGVTGAVIRRRDQTYTEEQLKQELWSEVHWHYFRAARGAGDRGEMAKRLTTLVELGPQAPQILYDVVPGLDEAGRRGEADKLFEGAYAAQRAAMQARGGGGEAPEPMNALAWLCAKANRRLDDGLALVGRALELRPDTYAYLDTAAELHFLKGEVARAVELEERAVGLRPEDGFLRGQLARFRGAGK